MTAHAGCRIRTVRIKASGFVLHLLVGATDEARISFMRKMRALVDDAQGDGHAIVGFAAVLWDANLGSVATLQVGRGSTIPSIAMAEFVKNRLVASKVTDWMDGD